MSESSRCVVIVRASAIAWAVQSQLSQHLFVGDLLCGKSLYASRLF